MSLPQLYCLVHYQATVLLRDLAQRHKHKIIIRDNYEPAIIENSIIFSLYIFVSFVSVLITLVY